MHLFWTSYLSSYPSFLKVLFYICSFGCAGSSLLQGFALVVESRAYPLAGVRELLAVMAALVSTGHRVRRLHSSRHGPRSEAPGPQGAGSAVVVRGLSCLPRVGSTCIRDKTCTSCIGRWTLYHWAAREAPVKLTFSISAYKLIHFKTEEIICEDPSDSTACDSLCHEWTESCWQVHIYLEYTEIQATTVIK